MICNALMMITGVIETFAICRWYRFHWSWFSLQGYLALPLFVYQICWFLSCSWTIIGGPKSMKKLNLATCSLHRRTCRIFWLWAVFSNASFVILFQEAETVPVASNAEHDYCIELAECNACLSAGCMWDSKSNVCAKNNTFPAGKYTTL